MAIYEFRAVDSKGKTEKGKIEAATAKQAASKIKGKGLHPLSINTAKTSRSDKSKKRGQTFRSSISSKVITAFTRQLSVLISTGIPYDRALEILISESENASFQGILSEIRSKITEGSSLAKALQNHPEQFSNMYVAMVRAGEAGGTLAKVLDQLANTREENEDIVSRIQKAMIYPTIMSLMGIGIVIFMITFIIPKIIPIFHQFEIDLPLPTRMVLGTSQVVVNNWILILALLILSIFSFYRFIKTRKGKRIVDRFLLKLPVIGTMLRKIVVFRFTGTLGTLLSSGVSLKQSLDIVKYVVANLVFEDKFEQITNDITKKGYDLSHALRKTEEFPLSVIQMIRVGEESSKLDEMLGRIAHIQEKEVKQSLENSVALLEPVMILVMALMVGFIVLAVMLPMFKLNQLL